ncbi:MAG: hypothetical protein KatS3mg119_1932 [Rhodothalassiaceae bacterium]|nr:MAG: hypothetical protein KatS3mg119_1932 [Rhodothalassiaceae bacterium]
MRPLYDPQEYEPALRSDTIGHAGLWYDKFCDQWKDDWSGFRVNKENGREEAGKLTWIREYFGGRGRRVGDRELLDHYIVRRKNLVDASKGQAFALATQWRFVTGLGLPHPVENGFLWHPTLGVPFIPGSALKGLARAFARDWEKADAQELARRIFSLPPPPDPKKEKEARQASQDGAGHDERAVGSVIFLDALPCAPVGLDIDVMTPHYGAWYQEGGAIKADSLENAPADWHSPNPIPFLTVAPGNEFLFAVLPRRPEVEQDRKDAETAACWLKQALATLGAGAKTAAGYGVFCVEPFRKAEGGNQSGNAESSAKRLDDEPPASLTDWVGRQVEAYTESGRVVGVRGGNLLIVFDADGEGAAAVEVPIGEAKPI